MQRPADDRVRAFLALTLAQWQIDATVEAGTEPVLALLRCGVDRGEIAVERAPSADPFRWYVRQAAGLNCGSGSVASARRPCGSLVGVLGALRRILEVESGGPARVVD